MVDLIGAIVRIGQKTSRRCGGRTLRLPLFVIEMNYRRSHQYFLHDSPASHLQDGLELSSNRRDVKDIAICFHILRVFHLYFRAIRMIGTTT